MDINLLLIQLFFILNLLQISYFQLKKYEIKKKKKINLHLIFKMVVLNKFHVQ